MIQKPMQCFESDCGRARIYADHEMPVGAFHDFLLLVKGKMVDIMTEAQKKEAEEVANKAPSS